MVLVAVSLVGIIASSRHFETRSPELSIELFPVNVEALLTMSMQSFAGGATPEQLEDIERRTRALLPFNAGDARLYSLIGEAERQKGASDQALMAFGRSLSLARTERHALQWVLRVAIERGDYADALERFDALFRRWPEQILVYAPLIPQVFAGPQQYQALLRRLEASPPWRTTLLSRLAGNGETLAYSAKLIEDLVGEPAPLKTGEISNVLNGLINAGRYEVAYRTFLMTLSPEEQPMVGHVYDGQFRLKPSGRPFDWQIRDHPGVVFSYPGAAGSGAKQGLTLTFQHAPVRNLKVRQYLLLPPARYSLRLQVRANEVALPKGLFWRVRCGNSNRVLVELAMPDGSYSDGFVADLTVPSGECPFQILDLSTKAVADNWNERYRGWIAFDAVGVVQGS
jgi:tetratricopeptide (TPR) repeat protein